MASCHLRFMFFQINHHLKLWGVRYFTHSSYVQYRICQYWDCACGLNGFVWLFCFGLILILNCMCKGWQTSCEHTWHRHVRLWLCLATQAANVHGGPFSDFPPAHSLYRWSEILTFTHKQLFAQWMSRDAYMSYITQYNTTLLLIITSFSELIMSYYVNL